jgi:hypothetical protein
MVGLLCTSDQLAAETSDNTQHSQQTSVPPAGCKPTITTGERPQIHGLERATTEIGHIYIYIYIYIYKVKVKQSRYRPGEPRGFQEVKVPRLQDNGTGWW